jgi:hypothetical protein
VERTPAIDAVAAAIEDAEATFAEGVARILAELRGMRDDIEDEINKAFSQ